MADKYILIRTICTHYGLEQDFLDRLNETSLISYHIKDQDIYINKDQIGNLEKSYGFTMTWESISKASMSSSTSWNELLKWKQS